jgi:hypothetical protein
MSETNTLDEIISWNTSKLAKKFELGLDQHVKHDYKQILLESDLFRHLRLYWMYESKEMILHFILPEEDIFIEDHFLKYDSTKLEPLLHISEKIWDSFKVNTIQTYHELGVPTSYKNVRDGELPSSEPFSIVSNEDLNRIEKVLNDQFLMKKLNRGFLILQKDIGIQHEGRT